VNQEHLHGFKVASLVRELLYDLLVAFLNLVVRVFFRSIEVSGRENVPTDGPVIFVGNHPNSLLDPVLVTVTCGRRVRFAAKETLFAAAPLRPFLWVLGSVPVRRRQDQVEGAKEDDPAQKDAAPARVDNSNAFDALFSILEGGEAFGIFPEGISHTRPELAPLKTGAARIALGAAEKGIAVRIVPVGLTYRRRDRMRSRVLVQLGEPLVVDEARRQALGADPQIAARELTKDIGLALRALTINAPDFEVLRVLEGVRRLYRPAHIKLSLTEQAELMRRFLSGWERLRDTPEVRRLFDDTAVYLARLRSLGLTDRDLREPPSALFRLEKLARHLLFFLVLVPFALPGIILHAPVLVLAVLAGGALTDRNDVRATVKMCAATLGVLGAYGAVAGWILWRVPPPDGPIVAAGALTGLVLSGWATVRVLERQAEIRRGLSTLIALWSLDREIAALTAMRDALRGRLLLVVDQNIGDLERIIARGDQKDAHPWLDDEDAD
jgi:glycerol-3-phosphate O-acyltransferase / dihydroxyacetone phosphate acyltransferase